MVPVAARCVIGQATGESLPMAAPHAFRDVIPELTRG